MHVTYLDELAELLAAQSEDWMQMSELDGFLAGIVVCPEHLLPSQWLHSVGGEDDATSGATRTSIADLERLIDLIFQHHNAILGVLARPDGYEPVFDIDKGRDEISWEAWIEGFTTAMDLAPDAWRWVAEHGDADSKAALVSIKSLSGLAAGELMPLALAARWHRAAPELIPACVEALYARHSENESYPSAWSPRPHHGEPCDCGSDKQFRQCCGLN